MTFSPRTLAVSTVSCVFRRTRFLAFIDLALQGGGPTAAACRSIKRSEAARFPRSIRFLRWPLKPLSTPLVTGFFFRHARYW